MSIPAQRKKRVHYIGTIPFIREPLLAEDPYPYYDWFTSLRKPVNKVGTIVTLTMDKLPLISLVFS